MSIEQVRDAPELMTVRLPDGFMETYVKLSDYKALDAAAVALRAERDAAKASLKKYVTQEAVMLNQLRAVRDERDTLAASLARVTLAADMSSLEKGAYRWATNQQFNSVSARNATVLAGIVTRLIQNIDALAAPVDVGETK